MSIEGEDAAAHVCIVGGGLVGVSFALALRHLTPSAGLKISLLESFPMQRTPQAPAAEAAGNAPPDLDARSTALSWGTRGILQRLALWDELSDAACAIRSIHVSEQGRVGVTRMHAAESNVPALGYVAENAALGRTLLSALQVADRVDVRAPVEVLRVRPTKAGQSLTVRPSGAELAETLTADLVVVCDGGRSNLCRQLGLDSRATDYRQQAMVFNVLGSQDHEGVAYERFTPSGPMALLPLSGRRRAVICTLTPDTAADWMAASDEQLADRLQDQFGRRLGPVEAIGQRALHPLSLRVVSEQARPGLVVLGNAAHTLHPVAGQGFNLSMRDVSLLADTVAAQIERGLCVGDLGALQAYEARRMTDQAGVIGFTHGLTRLFSSRLSALGAVRSSALVSLDLLAPARRLLAQHAMGMA